jgi:hypothetical protein
MIAPSRARRKKRATRAANDVTRPSPDDLEAPRHEAKR